MSGMPESLRMIVTFMSDFGTEDGYTGAVKGKLKSAYSDIEVIDITHSIPVFDVNKAAYSLLTYYRNFPKNTIHLCVVDPGVGSERNGVILKSDKFYFVGPDNGLFNLLQSQEKVKTYKIIYQPEERPASTFHGRDIFADVAAKLATGSPIESLGELQPNVRRSFRNFFIRHKNTISVVPLTSDHFGNIIFGIQKKDIGNANIKKIEFMGSTFESVYDYYAQLETGKFLCLWNSLNYLEIAINQGSAISKLKPDFKKDRVSITVEYK